ncbi:hypothetical protein, partial [Alistipes sp.]|uniref:hypothetical protein n=1 Tax=Alistipes sp. TaxID=1872444 RepID=UPI0025BD938F
RLRVPGKELSVEQSSAWLFFYFGVRGLGFGVFSELFPMAFVELALLIGTHTNVVDVRLQRAYGLETGCLVNDCMILSADMLSAKVPFAV